MQASAALALAPIEKSTPLHVADIAATRAIGGVSAPVTDGQPDRLAAIAFVADEATEAALRSGLSEFLGSLQVRRGGLRHAIRALEAEASPRMLMVDVSGLKDPVGELDALSAVCAPDTTVLVIGERADIEFYRDITRNLGVSEYLTKPLTRDHVATLVGPYVAGATPERVSSRGGRVVVVCGARGGVGATTVAVNLTLQIAERTRGQVVLLDLHLRGGHAAMMMGVTPSAGLRLALEKPHHADTLLLDRVAIPVGDRLRVIAAEESFETDPAPTAEGVTRVVELLRQRFNVVVVDMPSPPSAAERQALLLARHVLVVLGPDLASLRDAEQTRRMVAGMIGAGRTLMVVNRANAPGALKANLVQEGLGAKPDAIIPDLPRALPRAANMGNPALPESVALQRALAPITQEISGIAAQRRRGGLFGRLLGR